MSYLIGIIGKIQFMQIQGVLRSSLISEIICSIFRSDFDSFGFIEQIGILKISGSIENIKQADHMFEMP